MVQFIEWDGGDAFGVPAAHWRDNYATPGKLLFATDDAGALITVQQWAPGGGLVPITDANLAAVKAAVTEQLTPPAPSPGTGDPVTREEYDALMTMVLEAL